MAQPQRSPSAPVITSNQLSQNTRNDIGLNDSGTKLPRNSVTAELSRIWPELHTNSGASELIHSGTHLYRNSITVELDHVLLHEGVLLAMAHDRHIKPVTAVELQETAQGPQDPGEIIAEGVAAQEGEKQGGV